MRKFYMSLRMMFYLIPSFLLVFPAHAQDYRGTAQFLIDQGKQNYHKGDLSAALHEFSKALLVDPGNATAKDYLGKMGFQDGLYNRRPSPLVRSATLAQQVKVFKDKWSDSEKANEMAANDLKEIQGERDSLCLLLEQKKHELGQLDHQLRMVQENFQQENLETRKHARDLEAMAVLKEEEIAFLERFTDRHKKLVNEKEEILSKKAQEIEDLNERMHLVKLASLDDSFHSQDQLLKQKRELVQTKRQLAEMQLAYVPKISEPSGESVAAEPAALILDQKIKLLKQRDQDIAQLKERLVAARQQINTLQKSSRPGDAQEVSHLKKQVEEMRQRLSQKTSSLESEQSDLVILKERLQDAQEQLGIVKTMVREKETEIKELQDQISQVRSQCK